MAEAKDRPQMELEENLLEDADLLALLRQMQQAKLTAKEAPKKVTEGPGAKEKAAEEAANVFMDGLNLEDDVTYRCGQFQIVPGFRGGTDVSFTTDKRHRFAVKVIGE